MPTVVADTHAIIWYLFDQNKLSINAFNALDNSVNKGGQIYISAISLIEITYLIEKGRLTPEVSIRLNQAIQDIQTGLELVPIDFLITSNLNKIDRETVPDMPDRIIAATALALDLPLVTRDSKIQKLKNPVIIW